MRHLGVLLTTLAFTVSFAVSTQAQRGMGMRGGFARPMGGMARPAAAGAFARGAGPRTGVPPMRTTVVGSGAGFRFVHEPFFGHRPFLNNGFGFCHSHFCRGAGFHHFFFDPFFNFGFGGFPFYSGVPVVYGYADTSYEPTYAAVPQENDEVRRLAADLEEERLRREELESELARMQAAPPVTQGIVPQTTEIPAPAILVFRDGTRMEVQNYAIVGGTLYAFVSQRTRKIRIADLDLRATEKVNEARGVDFRLPQRGQVTTHP